MQEPETTSASGSAGAIVLLSPAWLRHGPGGMFGGATPGVLIGQAGGKITYLTKKGMVFEAKRGEIGVNWPWWEFGAGVHFRMAGKVYRLSLARPPHMPDINLSEEGLASRLASLDPTGINSLGRAFANGKAWKDYLNT